LARTAVRQFQTLAQVRKADNRNRQGFSDGDRERSAVAPQAQTIQDTEADADKRRWFG